MIENKDIFLHELYYYSEELKNIFEEYGAEVEITDANNKLKISIKYGGD